MNYEKSKYYIETTNSEIIENYNINYNDDNIDNNIILNNTSEIILNNTSEIILNNTFNNNIDKLFEKTKEFNEKINFIKSQLSNEKLKKSISKNFFDIVENIEKSIDVIDETIISNGII